MDVIVVNSILTIYTTYTEYPNFNSIYDSGKDNNKIADTHNWYPFNLPVALITVITG